MKLNKVKHSGNTSYYLAKSIRNGKKISTKNISKIGSYNELIKTYPDPEAYAKEYVKKANILFEENKFQEIKTIIDHNKRISKANLAIDPTENSLNVGYLYLQEIYSKLKTKEFFKRITADSKIAYDADEINRFLTISRILEPNSKKGTFDNKDMYVKEPEYKSHQAYRFLDLLAKNSDAYQEHLYKHSKSIIKRDTRVLYYDCTNFFFEIESEDKDKINLDDNSPQPGLRKYGRSKENRPLPIVQMGLFMDTNGIPLGFSITPGNTNEQTTVKPLEKKIIKDFELSKFIYCADAGLGSNKIKVLNNSKNKSFIVTQSLKKLKKEHQQRIFTDEGWKNLSNDKDQLLSEVPADSKETYYKEIRVETKIDVGLSKQMGEKRKVTDYAILKERIIITYQKKYDLYQKNLRNEQILRAKGYINDKNINRPSQTSPKRFIDQTAITSDGEVASVNINTLNNEKIKKEEKFDGYYALSTNLEGSAKKIVKINSRRWEIEESFRIMKTNFKARPVYLSKENRIKAHFLTCFTALLVYRLLEKKLDTVVTENKFTTERIIKGLKKLNVTNCNDIYYKSLFKGSEFSAAMNSISELDLDFQTYSIKEFNKKIKKIS